MACARDRATETRLAASGVAARRVRATALIYAYVTALAAGCAADDADQRYVTLVARGDRDCRAIATYSVAESSSTDPKRPGKTHSERTCSFDAAINTLACEFQSRETSDKWTSVTTWASRDDVIAQDHPIGHFTNTTMRVDYPRPFPPDAPPDVVLNGPCAHTKSRTYASDGRPLMDAEKPDDERCLASSTLYSDWDDAGRPLSGATTLTTSLKSTCTEPLSYSYDDDERTMITETSDSTRCLGGRETLTFDVDHNQVSSQFAVRDIIRTTEITIQSVETICR